MATPNKILALFNDFFGHIKYDYSFEIDMTKDDLGLVTQNEMIKAQQMIDNVEFVEKISDKYICLINDNIFIFMIDTFKNILNVYMENKNLGKEYVYTLYLIYKNNLEKKFTKIVLDGTKLLCLGIDDEKIIVIEDYKRQEINISNLADKKIKVIDGNVELKKKLEKALKDGKAVIEKV